jgi:hypothetical protein
MGWTWSHKPKHVKAIDWLRKELGRPIPGGSCEILADALVERSEYYALMKCTNGNGYTVHFLLVCMIGFSNSEFNIGYKDMTDTTGPTIARCPEKILDLADELAPLTPTGKDQGPDWAIAWRARCREYHRRRKLIANGTRIKFKRPISFTDGSEWDAFEVRRDKRGTRFVPVLETGQTGYGWYRISRVADREFEVLQK